MDKEELRSEIRDVVEEEIKKSSKIETESDASELADKKVSGSWEGGKQFAKKGLEMLEQDRVGRRDFLKMLGLGGAGIGIASSGAAASLLSGTTIDGYKAFHAGNDGDGSGLNADEVDGIEIYVQGSQPSNPSTNDVWIDTS